MAPVVHGLEAKYHGKINFAYLDIDDPLNADFKRQFGFRYQPQFVLVDGAGNVVKIWLGRVRAEEFEAEFNKLLGE